MSAYEEAWLVGPLSTKLYTRSYAPPTGVETKAVVVFLHGFDEHIARYSSFHPKFSTSGIYIFTYDQRGFGETALNKQRSKDSKYGKTSWPEQFADAAWAIGHIKATVPNVPIFLMGHSMGGALTLGFATRLSGPAKDNVSSLSGVIALSPLIHQSIPAPKIMRFLGKNVGMVLPHLSIPADVTAEHLSHDPVAVEAYKTDPLIKPSGTLRGIDSMLSGGEGLLIKDYSNWPESLPLLIIHGTGDLVCSPKASNEFYGKLTIKDKKLSLYENGFHELMHEPDGVKEKLAAECIAWIEAHIQSQSAPDAAGENAKL